MATLRCRVAERLLIAYLRALSDSNRTHLDYLRKLKSGGARSLEKALKDRARQLRGAHEALLVHIKGHGCLPPRRMSGRSRRKGY